MVWLALAFAVGAALGAWVMAAFARAREAGLRDTFKAIASEALLQNNQTFLDLAETRLRQQQEKSVGDLTERQNAIHTMVKPLQESVTKLEALTRGETASLRQFLTSLHQSQEKLTTETSKLSQAMRTPQVRGRWGEAMLRQTVELAGMTEHVDFVVQDTLAKDGQMFRPDMMVNLPDGKRVIIDAKTPLEAYLNALQAEEADQRQKFLKQHAGAVREHIRQLSSKAYHDNLNVGDTVDCTVLFVPGEDAFRAALQFDAELLDDALTQKILLASPFTLIALLKSVEHGWRQQRMTESAQEVAQLGRILYERLAGFAEHFGKVNNGLTTAMNAYNNAVGSFISRVMPTAKKFGDLPMAKNAKELTPLEAVEVQPRTLGAPETDATVHPLPANRREAQR